MLVAVTGAFIALIGLPFYQTGRYIERNPDKVVAQLQKIYGIDFPEQIKEVRVAKTRVSWDGGVGFKVRFTAEPDVVDRFLESFTRKVEFEPYDPELDTRGSGATPGWFIEPIRQGKEDTGVLLGPYKKSRSISIYIDTTDEKRFVVYIAGGYDRELDY